MRGNVPDQAIREHSRGFIKTRPAGNGVAQFTEIANVNEGQLARIPGRVFDPGIVGQQ